MAKQTFTQAAMLTNNIQSQPDQVKDQAAALKLAFDQFGIDMKSFINTVMQIELAKTDANDAGANYIGAEGTFGTDNVGDEIKAIKAITDGLDTNVVKLSGNQTINGIKTFTSSPVVPETPTQDTQAASKGYVDAEIAGVVLGQIPDNSLTELKMAAEMKKQPGGVASYENFTESKSRMFMLMGG